MQGEQDSEVHGQAAPDEEVVDGRPVARVQPNLHRAAAVTASGAVTPKPHLLPRTARRAQSGPGHRRLAPGRGDGGPWTASYLHADHNDQRGRHGDGEGLVVSQLGAVIAGGLGEHPVGDEEHEHGGVDALGDADEEFPLVEQEVQLAGLVQLWVLHAPLLRDVLPGHGAGLRSCHCDPGR